MRWFKHMADSHEDEKLADLVAECGLEAYGFWWILLEVVASQMDKNNTKCSANYPLSRWASLCYCHHHAVSKYLGKLQVRGMVTVEVTEGKGYSKIEVTIPNLLKYRDEYSKKSVHSSDKLRSKNIEGEVEGEVDLNTIAVDDKSPPTPAAPTPTKKIQKPKLDLDLISGEFINVNGQIERWKKAFPAVNVANEMDKAASWVMANPANRKSNYEKFLHNWLTRAQDKAPRVDTSNPQASLFPTRR